MIKTVNILRKLGLMNTANSLYNYFYLIKIKIYNLCKKNHLDYIYDDKFFDNKKQESILKTTPKIVAQVIKNLYNPKTVVDIGCGTGIYIKELNNLSVSVFGIDGSSAAKKNFRLPESLFLLQNITRDFNLHKKYDMALCFEVAEHIQKESSNILVQNITKLSNVILFTASPKGQGGIGHINEQDKTFWIYLFKKSGFMFNDAATKKLKKIFYKNNTIFWIHKNIMVFERIYE